MYMKKRSLLLMIPILVLCAIALFIELYPKDVIAGYSHNRQLVESYEDDDGKTIYVYNLYVDISGTSKINHVEGKLNLTGLEVLSFEPKEDFIGDGLDSGNTYSLTSNTTYTATDGRVVYAVVTVKQTGTDNCVFGFEPLSATLVATNDVDITKRALDSTKTSVVTDLEDNDFFYYEIKIINNSVIATDSLTLTDTIPDDFSIINADGGTVTNQTITWNIDSLAVNEEKTYYVLVQVNENANRTVFTIRNTASVTVNDVAKSANADVNILYTDLSITKTASKTNLMNGEEFYYTIIVTNSGTGTTNNIIVEDSLSSGLTFISSDTTYTLENGIYKFNIGALGAGESKTIKINAKVKNDTPLTTINNIAVAKEEGEDPIDDDAITNVLKPNLIITKEASAEEVKRGETFNYTITLTNEGTGSALNVNLSDVIDSDFEIVSTSEGTISGNSINISYDTILPKESKTITITVKVKDSSRLGVINNVINGSSDNNDDITASDTVTVIDSNLSISKTASKSVVKPGEEFTYTITLKNTGTAATNEITIVDVIDNNLQIINSDYASVNGNTLTWNIASLGSGATATYTVTVKVSDTVGNNTLIPNVVTAREIGKDEIESSVDVTVLKAILSIKKEAYNANNIKLIKSGEEYYYKITVTNSGGIASDKITITDTLNSLLTIVDADGGVISGQNITWTIDNLGVNESKEYVVTVKLSSTATINSIIPNEVKLTHNNDVLSDDDDITVVDSDIYIKKSASVDKVKPGEEFSYTIEIGNNGNEAETNLKLTDVIPDDLTLINYSYIDEASTTSTSGNVSASVNNGKLTFDIQSLVPSEVIKITLNVSVDSSATRGEAITNTAVLTFDDKNLNASADVEVVDTVISVKKESSVATVLNNDEFYYTITVTNTGDLNATNLTVVDTLDSKLEIVDADSGVASNNTITWNIPELDVNSSTSFRIKVKVVGAKEQDVIKNVVVVKEDGKPEVTDEVDVTVQDVKYSITKEVDLTEVAKGGNLTYTIRVRNLGNNTIENLIITDTLDEDLVIVSSGGAIQSANTLTWTTNLTANEEKTFTIIVKVSEDTQKDKIYNQASATYSDTDVKSNEVETIIVEIENPQTGSIISYITIFIGIIGSIIIFINIKKRRKFYRI